MKGIPSHYSREEIRHMTNEEKRRVVDLRTQGFGYKRIAQTLNPGSSAENAADGTETRYGTARTGTGASSGSVTPSSERKNTAGRRT